MTKAEVARLLAVAAAFDQRTTSEEDDLAWLAAIGDLGFDDARLAVVAHYRNSTERIMPGHIRAGVKQIRADRLARVPVPAPPAELADRPTVYRNTLRQQIQRLADGFAPPPAITGAPGEDGPPDEYVAARKALPEAEPQKPDLQALAREQAAEARRERTGERS